MSFAKLFIGIILFVECIWPCVLCMRAAGAGGGNVSRLGSNGAAVCGRLKMPENLIQTLSNLSHLNIFI